MRLLIGTTNPGKIEKIRSALDGIPWDVVTVADLELDGVLIEETGSTCEENARIKARGFLHELQKRGLNNVAVLADDGGVEIDALNGEPGIRAHRWAGEHATDEDIIVHTLKKLEGVSQKQRTARFRVTQVLLLPNGKEYVATGITEGWITESKRTNKTPGLPYSGLLVVSRYEKVLDDLAPEEVQHTHRSIALKDMRELIFTLSSQYA